MDAKRLRVVETKFQGGFSRRTLGIKKSPSSIFHRHRTRSATLVHPMVRTRLPRTIFEIISDPLVAGGQASLGTRVFAETQIPMSEPIDNR